MIVRALTLPTLLSHRNWTTKMSIADSIWRHTIIASSRSLLKVNEKGAESEGFTVVTVMLGLRIGFSFSLSSSLKPSTQAPLGLAVRRGLRRWAFWFTGTTFSLSTWP